MNKHMIQWYTFADAPVPISEARRDAWALAAAVSVDAQENDLPAYREISSGDSLVLAVKGSDGLITVYDALIRREGTLEEVEPPAQERTEP